MDDHHPGGFWHKGEPTVFYPTPSPYGIPYRCLYSKNIENLMFAGRCASWTHAALSSTRVQGTGASVGQAVGTAAAIAIREKITPREVGKRYIDELQQSLLRQDAYLPWVKQRFSDLTTKATLQATSGDPEPLRDGINRPVGDQLHAWTGKLGDSVSYTWQGPQFVKSATFIFDSALDKLIAMSYHGPYPALKDVPETLVRDFRVEIRSGGDWQIWREVRSNYQRLVRIDIGAEVNGVRATFDSTWGSDAVRVFAFWLE
jgi:hypothetical protein